MAASSSSGARCRRRESSASGAGPPSFSVSRGRTGRTIVSMSSTTWTAGGSWPLACRSLRTRLGKNLSTHTRHGRRNADRAPETARHPHLVLFVVASALAVLAAAFVAQAAGLRQLERVTSRFDARWLVICLGAELIGYVGYVLALRNIARVDGGPRLSFAL